MGTIMAAHTEQKQQMTLSVMIAYRCGQCCLVELGDALTGSLLHHHLFDWPGSNVVACYHQHDYTESMCHFAEASSCMVL